MPFHDTTVTVTACVPDSSDWTSNIDTFALEKLGAPMGARTLMVGGPPSTVTLTLMP
jgi:hypothetical protein